MRAELKKFIPGAGFETAERGFITEIANDPSDPAVSIARARVEPGVTTAWHKLRGTAERYIIVSGQGLAEVEDLDAMPVTTGDVIRK